MKEEEDPVQGSVDYDSDLRPEEVDWPVCPEGHRFPPPPATGVDREWLTPSQIEAITLMLEGQLTYGQIAQKLNLSPEEFKRWRNGKGPNGPVFKAAADQQYQKKWSERQKAIEKTHRIFYKAMPKAAETVAAIALNKDGRLQDRTDVAIAQVQLSAANSIFDRTGVPTTRIQELTLEDARKELFDFIDGIAVEVPPAVGGGGGDRDRGFDRPRLGAGPDADALFADPGADLAPADVELAMELPAVDPERPGRGDAQRDRPLDDFRPTPAREVADDDRSLSDPPAAAGSDDPDHHRGLQ